jgi:hypothetical protein
LAVALSLAITYYIWPEYFEQITDSIQWPFNNQRN